MTISVLVLLGQAVLLGLLFWGMAWSARRPSAVRPWPLRLVVHADGSPRLAFNFVVLGVSAVALVFFLADLPKAATNRQQQLDRMEQLLREIRDEGRR